MKFKLRQHFQIESARFLPQLPETHPCRRLHGHSFKIVITFVGEQHPQIGWVKDYHEVTRLFSPLLQKIDHQTLNDVEGLENPTSENLCYWIYTHGKKILPELTQVTVMETPTTECSYPC